MADLIRQMAEKPSGYMVTGQVAAVSGADGLDVTYRGGLATGLQFLSSYASPGIGDVVQVWVQPGQMFVLGPIGTTSDTLGPNLLPNPGFELGGMYPSSWGALVPQVTRVADPAWSHSSEASVKYDVSGLTSGTGVRLYQAQPITVDPGVTYRLAAWFLSPVADPAVAGYVSIKTAPTQQGTEPFDPGGTDVNVAFSAVTTSWQEIAGTFTIPAGHEFAAVSLTAQQTTTGRVTTTVYADDVSMRRQL